MGVMRNAAPLPVVARIASRAKQRSFIRLSSLRPLVIYKGIEYSVAATSEPDIWQWRFQIGDVTTTGRARTRLVHMATRRVQMRIDAALRASDPAADGDNLEA